MATKKKQAPKKISPPKTSRPVQKASKKAPARKPAPQKPVKKAAPKKLAKKAPARKPAPKKSVKKASPGKPSKKAAPKKPAKQSPVRKPAPKLPVKKAAPTKPAAKKTAAKKTVQSPVRPIVSKTAPAKAVKVRAFRREELAAFRSMLQQQLELVQGNLNALAGDNLKRSPLESTGDISTHSTHMADHGTDNFDRELALSLASSRQDSIYDIEDAIRRIDDGEYGTCEACEKPVERARLKALPFAKKCVACQNAAERGRGRYQPFRNNGPLQAMGAEDAADMGDS